MLMRGRACTRFSMPGSPSTLRTQRLRSCATLWMLRSPARSARREKVGVVAFVRACLPAKVYLTVHGAVPCRLANEAGSAMAAKRAVSSTHANATSSPTQKSLRVPTATMPAVSTTIASHSGTLASGVPYAVSQPLPSTTLSTRTAEACQCLTQCRITLATHRPSVRRGPGSAPRATAPPPGCVIERPRV